MNVVITLLRPNDDTISPAWSML